MLKVFDMADVSQKGLAFQAIRRRSSWTQNLEFHAAAHRIADALEAVALEQFEQTAVDPLDSAGAFIDPTGVDLHRPRAGANLIVGILGVENATDTDDRQPAARRP